MKEIVRRGEWLYDEIDRKAVYVIKTDFDFWHEIGKEDGDLEPGEEPQLNDLGHLYYVCFRSDPNLDPGWVDSQGFNTAEEASIWAEHQVISGIIWFNSTT